MRFFVCLIDPSGQPVSDACRRRYERTAQAHGLPYRWHIQGQISTMVAEDARDYEPFVVCRGEDVAVGMARLDNRADVLQWAGRFEQPITDLELVLHLVAQHGTRLIPDLLGDFAFLVWQAAPHRVIAACDAFAVRKLYHTADGDLLAFASRAEALERGEGYDHLYLSEIAGYCRPSPGRTVYAGVSSVPDATISIFERGRCTHRRYWSCHGFGSIAGSAHSEALAVDACRNLLARSVTARLSSGTDTWAQLSGGLDSSSVVSVAQWLACTSHACAGLAGTITYVDNHGTGADECQYARTVIERWGLRNEALTDWTIWQEDELGPPRTDQPSGLYPFYARDRKLCEVIRAAGGRVLLTGQGGDELFLGNMFFFADWLAAGRAWPSLKEMARRAAAGRVSFWELAHKNAILPMLPRRLQRRLVRGEGRLPPWLNRAAIQQHGLRERASAHRSYAGRVGHKYHDAIAETIAAIPAKLTAGVIDDVLEVRHPYLYRPLVELALSLPHEFTVRPYARKWILREAMRGILPEQIRTRVGKGVLLGLLSWSIARQREYLAPLTQDPILAQLGIIEPRVFQAAFTGAQYEHEGTTKVFADVQYTLALEAWLQVRSGRWPPRLASTKSQSRTQVLVPTTV